MLSYGIYLCIMSPFLIIGSVWMSNGYSPIYGGLRNHKILNAIVNQYTNPYSSSANNYECDNQNTYKVQVLYNEGKDLCTINTDKCYSVSYLSHHFALGSEIQIYHDVSKSPKCVTLDYAHHLSYVGFILLIVWGSCVGPIYLCSKIWCAPIPLTEKNFPLENHSYM